MVGMRNLNLKLLRDLKAAKYQFSAVVLVIFLGISMFICAYSAYLNLDNSYVYSFDLLNMGDYWISADYINARAVNELDDIPGVTAQGRIIGTVRIDLAGGGGERIEGKVISLPDRDQPLVNKIIVNSGSYFGSGSTREVLVEKHFADYHNIVPGNTLVLDNQGNKASYTVIGVITSPEYIYVTKSDQDVMPLPRTFGVLFVSRSTAEKLFDMEGMVNDISLLTDGTVDHEKLKQQIRDILPRFDIKRITFKNDPVSIETRKIDIVRGVRAAYVIERKDQVVNKLLKSDLESFQQIAFLFPFLFLSIASFTIYVLLSRLVDSQRVQIGLMRGLGYTKGMILFHYLGFSLVVGLLGSILGVIAGNFLGNGLTQLYVSQLNLPFTVIAIRWPTTLTGIFIGVIIPVMAGLLPAWSTMKLKPAIAMRPPAPPSGHKLIIEHILPFLSKIPYLFKLTMRNIFRRFRQSLFMALGVAFAVTLILVSMSFVDTFNNSLMVHFDLIQKYDAIVHYQDIGEASLGTYVSHLDGVKAADAVLELPYRLRFGSKSVDTAITGLPPGSTMYNLRTPEGVTLDISDEGILLPQSMKRRLGAEIGDTIELEPLTGTVGKSTQKVMGYIDFFMGGKAFISLREVQKMANAGGMATGIMLQFDGKPSKELISRLYDLPNAATVEFVEDTRQYIDAQMGFFWVFIIFMLIMGSSLGAAIIFNSVTVNVLQRTREIALMRVIGRSQAWLTASLTIENLIIGIAGVIIGMPMGWYIANYFMDSVNSLSEEAMTMNLVILPQSYVFAVVLALVMLLVSQIPALQRVRKMSLTTALKDWYE